MSKGMCWSHAATLRQHIQMSRPFNFPLGIAENILGVSGDRESRGWPDWSFGVDRPQDKAL